MDGCVFNWRGSSFWLACFLSSKFYEKSANTNGGPCLTTKESTSQLLKTSRYKYDFLRGIYLKKSRTTNMLDSGLFTNNETDKALLKVARTQSAVVSGRGWLCFRLEGHVFGVQSFIKYCWASKSCSLRDGTAFRYAEWYIGTKKHWVGRGSTLLDSNNIAILRHNVLPKLKPWVVWWPWLAVYLVPSYTVFGCVFDWRGSSFWLACFRSSKFYEKSANANGGPCLTTKESTTQLLKTSRYKYNFLHGIYRRELQKC